MTQMDLLLQREERDVRARISTLKVNISMNKTSLITYENLLRDYIALQQELIENLIARNVPPLEGP